MFQRAIIEVCERICPGTSPSGMPLCVLGVHVDKGLLLSLLLSSSSWLHNSKQTRKGHQKITVNNPDSNKDAS